MSHANLFLGGVRGGEDSGWISPISPFLASTSLVHVDLPSLKVDIAYTSVSLQDRELPAVLIKRVAFLKPVYPSPS